MTKLQQINQSSFISPHYSIQYNWLDAPVAGKRRKGRQKTRWKDSCKRDMEESVGLKVEDSIGQDKVEA